MAMRQEPILGLEEVKKAIENRLGSLPTEERERVLALAGGAAPEGEGETTYVNQVGSARRLLERVLEFDRRLNRRLAGENSFYGK